MFGRNGCRFDVPRSDLVGFSCRDVKSRGDLCHGVAICLRAVSRVPVDRGSAAGFARRVVLPEKRLGRRPSACVAVYGRDDRRQTAFRSWTRRICRRLYDLSGRLFPKTSRQPVCSAGRFGPTPFQRIFVGGSRFRLVRHAPAGFVVLGDCAPLSARGGRTGSGGAGGRFLSACGLCIRPVFLPFVLSVYLGDDVVQSMDYFWRTVAETVGGSSRGNRFGGGILHLGNEGLAVATSLVPGRCRRKTESVVEPVALSGVVSEICQGSLFPL